MTSEGVSLNPSDFDERQNLNLDSKREIKAISRMSYLDFLTTYDAPALTREDYFDMRWVPDVWEACTETQPRSHLFLYTHCFMSHRPELKEWLEARTRAKEQCADTGNEAGLLWLNKRPKYALRMISSGDRCVFPAWHEKVRGWFVSSTKQYRMSARILFIVYSSGVLLESGTDLQKWHRVLARDWEEWNKWVTDEKKEICRFFRLD